MGDWTMRKAIGDAVAGAALGLVVVIGAAHGYAWAGALAAMAVAAVHLAPRRYIIELKLIGMAAGSGDRHHAACAATFTTCRQAADSVPAR